MAIFNFWEENHSLKTPEITLALLNSFCYASFLQMNQHPFRRDTTIWITAEVFQKPDSPQPTPVNPGEPTFFVRVELQNASTSPLTFQFAEGAFVNSKGQGLRSKSKRGTDAAEFEIQPGEGLKLNFETYNYTEQILQDAKLAPPLSFELSLYSGEKIIQGPWAAVLPPLESLPLFYDPPGFSSQDEQSPQGFQLELLPPETTKTFLN